MSQAINATVTVDVTYRNFDGSECVCRANTKVLVYMLLECESCDMRGKFRTERQGAYIARHGDVWFDIEPSQFSLDC